MLNMDKLGQKIYLGGVTTCICYKTAYQHGEYCEFKSRLPNGNFIVGGVC